MYRVNFLRICGRCGGKKRAFFRFVGRPSESLVLIKRLRPGFLRHFSRAQTSRISRKRHGLTGFALSQWRTSNLFRKTGLNVISRFLCAVRERGMRGGSFYRAWRWRDRGVDTKAAWRGWSVRGGEFRMRSTYYHRAGSRRENKV